jgi:colanic acid/amylovoran biosynthesis glycosyltransferase
VKVLLVTEMFPALSETFILNQIIGLRRLGFDVTVVADSPRDEATVHDDVTIHGLMEKVAYIPREPGRFARLGSIAAWAAGTAFRMERAAIREIGNAIYDQATKGGLHCSIGRLSRYQSYLAGRLDRFDVALCHFGPNGDMLVRARESLGLSLPIATIFHGYDVSSYLKKRGSDTYHRLFRRGDQFLAVNDRMRRHLIDLGAPPERTFLQCMGVDCGRLQYSYGGGSVSGPFTFLFVGRLVEKKGSAVAIDALKLCRDAHPGRDIRLTVIGDGDLMEPLRRQADALGLKDAVSLVGAQQQSYVFDAIRSADAMVQPSVTADSGDEEGIPIVLQEAMALGLPVISSLHGGIPELIETEKSGLLVPERDVAALGRAMTRLAGDADLRRRLSLDGRRKVEFDFNLDRWNAVLAERLESLAGDRHRSVHSIGRSAAPMMP